MLVRLGRGVEISDTHALVSIIVRHRTDVRLCRATIGRRL